jgi:hypothetical protein
MTKPTAEQIEAARAWTRNRPTTEQMATLQTYDILLDATEGAASILLAALESAERDAERFRRLERAFADRQWFYESADDAKTLAALADGILDRPQKLKCDLS